MRKLSKLSTLALTVGLVLGSLAVAKAKTDAAPLESTMEAFVVSTDKEGKEVATPAKEVAPGQTVEYRLIYKNVSKKALKDIAVTGPIPSTTDYLANTANTKAETSFQVSIDGGKTFESEPVKRTVLDEKGKKVEKVIPPSEYTHVRWTMKKALEAGEAQTFAYRSLVN